MNIRKSLITLLVTGLLISTSALAMEPNEQEQLDQALALSLEQSQHEQSVTEQDELEQAIALSLEEAEQEKDKSTKEGKEEEDEEEDLGTGKPVILGNGRIETCMTEKDATDKKGLTRRGLRTLCDYFSEETPEHIKQPLLPSIKEQLLLPIIQNQSINIPVSHKSLSLSNENNDDEPILDDLCYEKEKNALAIVSRDAIKVWDLNTNECSLVLGKDKISQLWTHPEPVDHAHISNSKITGENIELIICLHSKNCDYRKIVIGTWNSATKRFKISKVTERDPDLDKSEYELCFDLRGEAPNYHIVRCSCENSIICCSEKECECPRIPITGHTGESWEADAHVKKEIFVTYSADHTTKIWNAKTGECLRTLHHGTCDPVGAELHGDYLITHSLLLPESDEDLNNSNNQDEQKIKITIWNWKTGQSVYECTSAGFVYRAIIPIISENNTGMLGVQDNNTLHLFDVRNVLSTIEHQTNQINNLSLKQATLVNAILKSKEKNEKFALTKELALVYMSLADEVKQILKNYVIRPSLEKEN